MVGSIRLLAELKSITMGFEDISKDRKVTYPCECGGTIAQDHEQGGMWQCDNCD